MRTYRASPDDGSVLDSSCEVIWLSPNSTISTACQSVRRLTLQSTCPSAMVLHGQDYDDSWERVTDDEDLVQRALLVDVKDDGVEWRRGRRRIPSTVDDVGAWKAHCRQATSAMLRTRRTAGLESLIVDADSSRVQVHFKGLEDSCDEWMAKDSPRILPPYTQVQIGAHSSRSGHGGRGDCGWWKAGRVTKVDRQDDQVQLRSLLGTTTATAIATALLWSKARKHGTTSMARTSASTIPTHVRQRPAMIILECAARPRPRCRRPEQPWQHVLYELHAAVPLPHRALRDYFLSGRYEADINRTNPIGTGGGSPRSLPHS